MLLNIFVSPRVQSQTFQVSCGFKFSFWCLTTQERHRFYYFLLFKTGCYSWPLAASKECDQFMTFTMQSTKLSSASCLRVQTSVSYRKTCFGWTLIFNYNCQKMEKKTRKRAENGISVCITDLVFNIQWYLKQY